MYLLVALTFLAFVSAGAASAAEVTAITVHNGAPDPATGVPVSLGVPFRRGAVREPDRLFVAEASGSDIATQAEVLSRWPDGSIRWALLDFLADAPGGGIGLYMLGVGTGGGVTVENPVRARCDGGKVVIENELVRFEIACGSANGTLTLVGDKASAEIISVVEIGHEDARVTSKTIVLVLHCYAAGPVRAAVDIRGRRVYSDGIEGPFSQRVEVFAGSPWVKVEDTFIYAHFPGKHASPQNPLARWAIEAQPTIEGTGATVVALTAPEESDGLVVTETSAAFWGVQKPLALSRHTDEELVGEDTPGIALGLGKSCAALVGLRPSGEGGGPGALGRLWAHAEPRFYTQSGAFGALAPYVDGRHAAIEEGLRQALGFWLWYQDHDPDGSFGKGPWHGILDWGDWQTRFADRRNRPTGWNYYEGRYGWVCNEPDITLMLWVSFLRTGRPEYWRAAVAMSRHAMDVDVINVDYRKYELPEYVYDPHSYGAPWKEGRDRMDDLSTVGLGRRHNVQHWGNGVGDTRHTWNGGVLMYYYLTGNRRAYDTAIAMADMHMQRMWGSTAGEYSAGLWAICNAWQLTGDARYRTELDYRIGLVHRLRLPDGSLAERIDFQKSKPYPEIDGDRGAYLDLALDYISNALVDYYADTGDARARDILLGLAERFLKDAGESPACYFQTDSLRILAWAYLDTGEERFLDRARYHLSSLEGAALAKEPESPEEWNAAWGVLGPHDWDIRVIGAVIRMAPYVLEAIDRAEGAKAVQHGK